VGPSGDPYITTEYVRINKGSSQTNIKAVFENNLPSVIPMASLRPIDLFRGWPASELLPVDSLKEAAIKALSNKVISDAGFGYGPDEGYQPLRQNIAKWLTEYYGPQKTITSDRICITGGASQNLASILQVFTDPLQTEMIWLVEPTYHLVFRSLEDAGFHGRTRGIPEDESGMDVHALERALENLTRAGDEKNSHTDYVRDLTALLLWCDVSNPSQMSKPARSDRKIYKHIIYCVPSFSNPSGTTMTRSRREALVQVARKYDALVICDDVYDFLAWTEGPNSKPIGHSIQRLVDIDRILDGGPVDAFGNVVSNGSFSKLLGPGCRVGWAEGSEAFAYGLSQA
jgi:DNA-binding transcriptional MocR family regulator